MEDSQRKGYFSIWVLRFIYLFTHLLIDLYLGITCGPQCVGGSWMTAFSLTLQVPEIKLKSLGLIASF